MMSLRRQCSVVLASPSSSATALAEAAAAALWPRLVWTAEQQRLLNLFGGSFSVNDRRQCCQGYCHSSVSIEQTATSNREPPREVHGRGMATFQGDETACRPSQVVHQVSEMHREMRQVFGSDLQHSIDGVISEEKTENISDERATRVADCSDSHQEVMHHGTISANRQHAGQLTHADSQGKARMVDVSNKACSSRSATASARVLLGPETYELVAKNQLSKGDVLTLSKVAGIMGAKHTSALIPLCHPILLSDVNVSLRLDSTDNAVEVVAVASTVGPTGVEMEALTAASVAALTVYDMCKASSKGIVITDVRLEEKKGGKSGHWVRPD
eukprot:jgi/Picsp_1/593/NSC_00590-R1_molybdopterin biosynthesis protein cnx3